MPLHSVLMLCVIVVAGQDLRINGADLAEILAAGEWRSAAFLRCRFVGLCSLNVPSCCRLLRYLDTCGLERDAVFEVAVNSDHEEWID
jgi:hypothetical protein